MRSEENGVKARVAIIRLRTWTLSITIFILLVFYVFVTFTIKERISTIDFILVATVQISTHFAYFPDGERYGEMDPLFINARKTYNDKATQIYTTTNVEKLREYCKYDYEYRKNRYIEERCGKIGISINEYFALTKKSKKELRKMEKLESDNGVYFFTKSRRREVIKLIYGKIKVKPNSPDKILSAIDRDYTSEIKDGSQMYRKAMHATRLFRSIVIGGVLAYVGYSVKDGISLTAIVKSFAVIASMIYTAVHSYIAGEKSSKEYRKRFYIELATFIDKFFSWAKITPQEN